MLRQILQIYQWLVSKAASRRSQTQRSQSSQSSEQLSSEPSSSLSQSQSQSLNSLEDFNLLQKKSYKKRSLVWEHFQIFADDNIKIAYCLRCREKGIGTKFIYTNSGTSSMLRHLRLEHGNFSLQKTQYLNSDLVIAKIASLDLISYKNISNSYIANICKEFIDISIPQTRSTISQIVKRVYNSKLTQYKDKLKIILKQTPYIILSIDSTQLKSRRFFNIFMYHYSSQPLNLGLYRQLQPSTAEYMQNIIKEVMNQFELSSNKIKYLITDGAANMIKLSKKLKVFNQRCVCHMLHLVIKKYSSLCPEPKKVINIKSFNHVLESDSQEQMESQKQGEKSQINEISNLSQSIGKVRSVCRKIRLSGVLKDRIQKQQQCQLYLPLDTPIRWNSTYRMLKHFLANYQTLESYIGQKFQSEELINLNLFCQTLECFNQASIKLSAQNTNLLTAQKIINALLTCLTTLNNTHSNPLSKILFEYYQKYRSKQYVSVGLYLENVFFYSNFQKINQFKMLTVRQCQQFILANFHNEVQKPGENIQIQQKSSSNIFSLIYSQKFERKIKAQTLEKDLQLYRQSQIKSERLKKIYEEISAIASHTVNNERGFSILQKIFNNERCLLSDKSIQALYFLRWYFRMFER